MIAFLLVLAILASLALAAFCAGAETGFLSVSRGRILHMARAGGARARIIHAAVTNLGRTTTALLVGNNLASVSFSSASAALSAVAFPESSAAQAVWSGAAAVTVLYFGEFAPKLLCAARPLRRMLQLAPIWSWFERVFVPVGAVVQAAIGRLMPRREPGLRVTPETVLKILEDRKDGVKVSPFERALIGRILSLRARGEFVTVEELMAALDDDVV